MRAARDAYYVANGFPPDGGDSSRWVDFKLGPLPMPFPNTAPRKRAVRLHDLHHVLTGYRTDIVGEFEISAWELAAGCGEYSAAWFLDLTGLAGGVAFAPRRTWRAFLRGVSSRNLYAGAEYGDALLDRTVDAVRAELGMDNEPSGATGADALRFAVYVIAGSALGIATLPLVPIAAGFGLATLVVRALRRGDPPGRDRTAA
jgi:hypothetical protein